MRKERTNKDLRQISVLNFHSIYFLLFINLFNRFPSWHYFQFILNTIEFKEKEKWEHFRSRRVGGCIYIHLRMSRKRFIKEIAETLKINFININLYGICSSKYRFHNLCMDRLKDFLHCNQNFLFIYHHFLFPLSSSFYLVVIIFRFIRVSIM